MLKIEHSDASFSLYYKNRCILKHSIDKPCIAVGNGSATYTMKEGNFKLKDTIISKQYLKYFTVNEDGNTVTIQLEDAIQLTIQADAYCTVAIQAKKPFNRFWMNCVADTNEHIYGCGEQFSKLDLKKKKVPLWVQEQGVGRGHDLITFLANVLHGAGGAWYTTYYPQLTFVSSSNYFIHCNASSFAEFEFKKKEHILHFWQIPESVVFGVYEKPTDCVKAVGDLLGRQPRLPQWVHDGMWIGVQGGTDVVKKKLQDAIDAGVKVSALWVQDWVGRRITWFGKRLFWNWKYNEDLYPNLPLFIQELSHNNIKFLGYINCFLNSEGDLYKEAVSKGYLVQNQDNTVRTFDTTGIIAGTLDLTNPNTREWIKKVIKEHMIGIGLSGWMADFGEYLETDVKLYSGESAELYHNKYPAEWARVNYEALEEAGKLGEIVFFTRAGYTGTSKYSTLMWAGDQLVNWSMNDGLASTIPAGISLGFCGIGYFHSDIGGYTTIALIKRKKELFMRWAELSAFTAVMRTHEGNRPDSNWQFDSDSETITHLSKMTKIHAALKPYIEHCKDEYHNSGLPLMRHPYIHYPEDERLHSFQYQYLFGRDLFVAPVYKPRIKRWKLYLPQDNWIHIWTGKEYDGGWVTVDAPLGYPPVFYRKESKYADLFFAIKNIV